MSVVITAHTPHLDALRKLLGKDGRKQINEASASSVFAVVARHMRNVAVTRHATATRLGATPTGHLEAAANSLQKSATDEDATLTITSPGFRRVFGYVVIRPRNARALTIPIHPWSYGRRVYTVSREHPIFRPKGTNILATSDKDGNLIPLYILVRNTILKPDRSLLPSDDDLSSSARKGVASLITRVLGAVQGGAA